MTVLLEDWGLTSFTSGVQGYMGMCGALRSYWLQKGAPSDTFLRGLVVRILPTCD